MHQWVIGLLSRYEIAETYGSETDETEVEGLEVAPALEWRVQSRGATSYRTRGQGEVEHNPVDARLPVVQTYVVVVQDVR